MKRLLVPVVLLMGVVLNSAFALPRYALMTGYRCASCHVNPTGGEMRNEYGTSMFSLDKIPMMPDSDFTFNPKLTDNITVGGDYRGQFLYDQNSKTTSFQGMTAGLYAAVQLGKKVTFYFKDDIVNPNFVPLSGPEAFGIVKPTSSVYIKGGIFMPDYGWRQDDHTSYTRGGDLGYIPSTGAGIYKPIPGVNGNISNFGLIFLPDYRDMGVEAGWMSGGLMVTGSILNGRGNSISIPDFNGDKAFTSKAEYMGSLSSLNYRIGASVYGFKSFHMGGFHWGLGMDDFVLFGEMDWTHNLFNGFSTLGDPTYGIITGVNSSAAFAELDWKATQGFWAIGKFDYFDPQNGLSDDPNGSLLNSRKRVTLGFEIFPYSFVEIRPQFRIAIETPTSLGNVGLVQIHYWF